MQQENENQANSQAQGQANTVIDLINQIGTVNAGSGEAINRARSAYNGLSDRAKGYVSNYSVLLQAETIYQSLTES